MKALVVAALSFLACQHTQPDPRSLGALPSARATAPVSISVAVQEPPAAKAKPSIYNEAADAKADIAAALARASKENRRVLLQWGGNWCVWCIKLHELYKQDAKIRKQLLYEYDVVYVDIGKGDKNQDLATLYGADLKQGVPYLTVLDGDGKVIANQETGVLENPEAKLHDPAKVLEFLTKHQAKYLKADELLAASQAQAAKESKRVLLTFGAPWCPWCHKLEDWMATPQANSLLTKDFVIRKIDVDRTIGGKELKTRFRAKEDGIPWFCMLEPDGSMLAGSVTAADENIGFPSKDEEIASFVTMLEKVAKNMSKEDIDTLKRSLVEVRENDAREAEQRKAAKSKPAQ